VGSQRDDAVFPGHGSGQDRRECRIDRIAIRIVFWDIKSSAKNTDHVGVRHHSFVKDILVDLETVGSGGILHLMVLLLREEAFLKQHFF
jgi:hypothetical protein